ncbi:polysaccharide deacetylase family protein [Hyphomicrobium sp. 99]|uniref:polysaccharide deacetylase family protein n=1 Tax=Hyphomicrobium sp. 99 TaxID=1163419 RepID=UPI0005F7BA74|nr:polysaccharide deacetylase family protein [Hyphomicrobium sp. 99]
MRQLSIYIAALVSLFALAAYDPLSAEIEAGGSVNVDACSGDPTRLGVSRVVEIDSAGGPNVGGDMRGAQQLLNDGEVVLTFDDGPMRSVTKPILKALADQCTKATFFMVGQMALADAAMVREVAAAGHTVATHTWSHKNIRAISLAKSQQEIEAAISTVSQAKGTPVAPLFRFPYLNSTKQTESYLKGRNIAAIWIDVDSKDYMTRSPKVALQRILAQLAATKKGIILMHDIHAWTAAMVPDLLKELHDRGFKVVHFVPKGQIETIASYDEAAQKALAAKAAKKAANPIATRSIVWPMSPAPTPLEETDVAAVAVPGAKHKANRYKKVSTKPSITDGLTGETSETPAQAAKNKKAVKPKEPESVWPSFFN